MDVNAPEGAYVWMKTTHKKWAVNSILKSIKTALAGDMRFVLLGKKIGDGSTTSEDDLIRSVFVATLKSEERSKRASSSSFNLNRLADIQGAVNSATGDDKRSNCRVVIMEYPPENVLWLDQENEYMSNDTMPSVTCRMEQDMIDEIDDAVEESNFKDRSELIRESVRRMLNNGG